MKTVSSIAELQEVLADFQSSGKRIGFVPTMGALHEGHLSLIDVARQQADVVVASIFVNPTQFAEGEDLETYPRDVEGDTGKLSEKGVDVVFTPGVEEIYPDEVEADIELDDKADILCGMSRPHFFHGVATVVKRLFEAVKPDVAVFGEKDFQQLWLIRRMVKELELGVEIVGAPIMREPDGLAMSSRNQYLTQQERQLAPELYRSMERIRDSISPMDALMGEWQYLTEVGFDVDYLEIRNEGDLRVAHFPKKYPARIFVAAKLGETRLIDNLGM